MTDDLTTLDAEIAATLLRLEELSKQRERLLAERRNAELDAHLARLRPEVLAALREPAPRARDLRLLQHHGLAYSNGGSSRHWTRDAGEPLRRRLLERDANPNPRNDP